MQELELEERCLKLEEDKLRFDREKWLQQQQEAGNQQPHHQYDAPRVESPPAQQVGDHQTLQPVVFFANDERPQPTFGFEERVLDPSEY